METRANYIAIGVFVLGVIASALGFVYYLFSSTDQGDTRVVEIIFPEAVTGLSTGSQVLFNGIRIGDVVQLGFPEGGGPNVIARARLNTDAPVKQDTRVELGFQGLTGVAYVNMTGGSQDSPSLFAEDGVPTMRAEVSRFQSIIETGQEVLNKADQTLSEINGLLADNRDDIRRVVQNAGTFSQALSDAAPQISGLIEDLASAGRAFAAAGPDVQSVLANVNALLSEIAPSDVRTIVENVTRFSTDLAAVTSEADDIIGVVRTAADDIKTFTEGLTRISDQAEAVVAAIDADRIASIVRGADTFVTMLADQSEEIASLIASADRAAGGIATVAGTIADKDAEVRQIIDDAAAVTASVRVAAAQVPDLVDALRPGIENLSTVLSAIDGEAVAALVENAGGFAAALNEQTGRIASILETADSAVRNVDSVAANVAAKNPEIAAIIDDAAEVAANTSEFSGQLSDLAETLQPGAENLAALLQAVQPVQIQDIVQNVQIVTAGIAQRSQQIGTLLDDAAATAANARQITGTVAARSEDIDAILSSVQAIGANVETFSGQLPDLIDTLQPGAENLSRALTTIDPEAIAAILANAREVSATLAAQRARIDEIVAQAQVVAGNLRTVTDVLAERREEIGEIIANARNVSVTVNRLAEQAQPAIDNLTELLGSVSGEGINQAVDGARQLLTSLAERREEIARAIDNVAAATENVRQLSETLREQEPKIRAIIDNVLEGSGSVAAALDRAVAVVDQIGTVVEGPGTRFLQSAAVAADEIAVLARAFSSRADTIASGVARFTTGGLDDVRALVNEGQRTLSVIQRAVANFDEAPNRVLFGGPSGPRYQPQRR